MRKKTLFILLLLAALSVLLYSELHRRELNEGFSYVSAEGQDYAAFCDAVAVFSPYELRLYDLNGNERLALSLQMTKPRASVCGDRCLVWDCGGDTTVVLSADGEHDICTAEGKLVYAELSDNGRLICTESGGTASATLLDHNGEPVFRSTLSDCELHCAALSPKGDSLALIYDDKLRMISTQNGEILCRTELPAKRCGWLCDELLCIVGETEIYTLTRSGRLKSFDAGMPIADAILDGDCIYIFARYHSSGGGGELICLSSSLGVIGKTETDAVISLDVGDGLLLSQERERTVLYGKDLRVKDEIEVKSVRTACMCGDDALIIQKDHIYLW